MPPEASSRRSNALRSSVILALMYAAFISLGLPDSILGAAWPVMQPDLGVPYSYAGVIAMVVASGTIVAAFFGGVLIQRLGAGALARLSVTLTALALFGFSFAPSFEWFLLFGVPLGLGGGAVDAALNHTVATHYKAHHMNWLHSFWGVGAMSGPIIMARVLATGGHWRSGYLTVAVIQSCLVVILLATIPMWREMEGRSSPARARSGGGASPGPADPVEGAESPAPKARLRQTFRLPGAWAAMLTFWFYAGVEGTTGLWGSSFLAKARSFGLAEAAFGVSLFFGSLTVGRVLAGFVSMKVSETRMIRASLILVIAGAVTVLLSSGAGALALLGLAAVGLGCAAIFPSMLHLTPRRFGARWAPMMMGVQMASAYTGATLLPPAFGWITGGERLWLLPVALLICASGMLFCTEWLNRRIPLPISRSDL